MDALSAHHALVIFGWGLLTILVVILLLIARFFQRLSRRRTHFWVFVLPIAAFGVASVRYASINSISGDVFADSLLLAGSLLLIGLCLHLYRLMTARH